MLPDNRALATEVAADIAKVRAAYADALGKVRGTPAEGGVTGLLPNIDDWAAKGLAAVKTPSKAPYPKGWSAWTQAGTVFISGLPDISDVGAKYQLDAVTATVRALPQETVKQMEAAAHAVKHGVQAAVATATSAVGSVARNAALAALAVVVILAVVRRAV